MDILFNTKLQRHHLPEKALSVRIDRGARTSGLLAFLSPEELQTLIALLTFADESGRCELSARMLGQAINLSEKQAQKRLKKLCETVWHGKPLLIRENGREMGRFMPTGYQLPEVEGLKIVPNNALHVSKRNDGGAGHHGSIGGSEAQEAHAPPLPVGEASIRKRRSTSGTPGTDVEGTPPANTRIIGNSCVVASNINNKHITEDRRCLHGAANTDKRKRILGELLRYGVSGSTASQMLDKYPIERISGQLEMLPFRNAKEPAAMLVKAIRDDWAAPATYMNRQRKETARKTKEERESAEAERRRIWQKQLEAEKTKLSREELKSITRIAREKMQRQLGGAFHGNVPERLVHIEVNRIISEKYVNHD